MSPSSPCGSASPACLAGVDAARGLARWLCLPPRWAPTAPLPVGLLGQPSVSSTCTKATRPAPTLLLPLRFHSYYYRPSPCFKFRTCMYLLGVVSFLLPFCLLFPFTTIIVMPSFYLPPTLKLIEIINPGSIATTLKMLFQSCSLSHTYVYCTFLSLLLS